MSSYIAPHGKPMCLEPRPGSWGGEILCDKAFGHYGDHAAEIHGGSVVTWAKATTTVASPPKQGRSE